jgi:putative methylase
MATKAALETQLAVVAGFENPRIDLEQYPTPPGLAAHVVHVADLNGDIDGKTVVDLGTGTGMLALGAALPVRADDRRDEPAVWSPERQGWR